MRGFWNWGGGRCWWPRAGSCGRSRCSTRLRGSRSTRHPKPLARLRGPCFVYLAFYYDYFLLGGVGLVLAQPARFVREETLLDQVRPLFRFYRFLLFSPCRLKAAKRSGLFPTPSAQASTLWRRWRCCERSWRGVFFLVLLVLLICLDYFRGIRPANKRAPTPTSHGGITTCPVRQTCVPQPPRHQIETPKSSTLLT